MELRRERRHERLERNENETIRVLLRQPLEHCRIELARYIQGASTGDCSANAAMLRVKRVEQIVAKSNGGRSRADTDRMTHDSNVMCD
jgi:hypothetical protein